MLDVFLTAVFTPSTTRRGLLGLVTQVTFGVRRDAVSLLSRPDRVMATPQI